MNPLTDLPRNLIDFETRSELDVRNVGAWRYAEHPSTEVLCMSYRLANGAEGMWDPFEKGEPFPRALLDAVERGEVFEAHNAGFEQAVWLRVLKERQGIPMPTRWADTLATCAYRSLPLGLDDVGKVLDLDVQKDQRGKYLLNQLSKPRRPRKAEREAFEYIGLEEHEWPLLWREDPDLVRELRDYCMTDTKAEHSLSQTIGDLPLPEYRVWTLDQRVNYRGVRVDVEAVEAAISIVEYLFGAMERELQELTGGEVETGSQVLKIKEWLGSQAVDMPDLTADTVEWKIQELCDLVTDGHAHPDEVAVPLRVLEIRQTLGSSSVKKLYKFLECLCADERIRGILQYHAAGTGRWAGRLVQPQNFPRGRLEDYVEMLGLKDDPEGSAKTMEILIDAIKLGGKDGADMLANLFGSVIDALSTALRGMFIAAEGHQFRIGDFSAIEAVVLAWVAGEEWKLEAFSAIQRGEKYKGADDIYCATASMILGRPVNKKEHKADRQNFGKVPELAFGYEGGIGAWYSFDKRPKISDKEINDIKIAWRDRHPATAGQHKEFENSDGETIVYHRGGLWDSLKNAAIEAVQMGRRVSYRMIAFEPVTDAAGNWLTIILPNGRRLWYYDPQVHVERVRKDGSKVYSLGYQGRDNKRGGRWDQLRTYGGMITENVVQAIARDLMAEAMIRLEKAGYKVLLTVHDEVICENEIGHGSQDEFEAIMAIVPEWAEGCPVGVDGWCGTRYRKD